MLPEQRWVFGSQEWLTAFVNTLNSDREYNDAAKNWEEPITLAITNLPSKVSEFFKRDSIVVWLDLYHGQCRTFEVLNNPEEKPAPIIISGSYESMKKVALGQLNPTVAIMTGQLKVRGNVFKLITNAGASAAFVNAIKKVPTEFLA